MTSSKCRVCGAPIQPFMSFGRMPIANGFLLPAQIPDEYFFELAPCVCGTCHMFQLFRQPEPEKMFHQNYAFFSSTSRHMQAHFAAFANAVIEVHLNDRSNPFVVEIGSNDGIMLRTFRDRGMRHLGIEPSRNVAAVAIAGGIRTVTEFFNTETARAVVAVDGQADSILAANVIAHIADLPSVAEGIAILLKPDGVFIFENAYLGAVIENTAYDQIYDEHVFTFCAMSVSNAFGRHGLELIDVQPQPTHGGSMRYVLAHKGARRTSASVSNLLAQERSQGLDKVETYEMFRLRCEESRAELRALLQTLSKQNTKVVGYGATAKSTTVLNYCGLTSNQIAWISDNTPVKQGKLSPGAHIPIRPRDAFVDERPDYAVLFAWNHSAEIREAEREFSAAGGCWITYVPQVAVDEPLGVTRDMKG